jgi:hypothetical protein
VRWSVPPEPPLAGAPLVPIFGSAGTLGICGSGSGLLGVVGTATGGAAAGPWSPPGSAAGGAGAVISADVP